jgi:hypothetical protein
MLKRCRNQAKLTPEVFFSFFPSLGFGGRWPVTCSTISF